MELLRIDKNSNFTHKGGKHIMPKTNTVEAPRLIVRTKRDTKAINALAREWADFVGGFGQAQKIIAEAYEMGLRNSVAPELLRVAQVAVNLDTIAVDDGAGYSVYVQELRELARAAIAKAEGRE